MDVTVILLVIAGIVGVVASVQPQAGRIRLGWISLALMAFGLAFGAA